jgi:rhodanese-related sulfurtransferase
MFEIFKNLFGLGDNSQLTEAMHHDAFLVDVRTPDEFSKGSVEGAVNIPLKDVGKRLSKFEDKENIIVFCQSGMRSGRAKKVLEQNGFEDVINGRSPKNIERAKNE